MQAGSDRVLRLAEHPGSDLGIESGDDAQLYHCGLVLAESSGQRGHALARQTEEHLILHRLPTIGGDEAQDLIVEASPGTCRVNSAVPPEGKQPGPEIRP